MGVRWLSYTALGPEHEGGRRVHALPKTDDASMPEQKALCGNDLDCSLNGRCSQGRCECDKPWSGDSCGTMRFRPVSFPQGYGQSPNLTAWGGGAIYEAQTKTYHAYVHALANGCPLACGPRASRIEHGVSKTITGPYEFRDVAVAEDARNSAPITLPDGSFAIFHIGSGSMDPSEVAHCSAGGGTARDSRAFGRFPCRNSSAAASPGRRRLDESERGSTIHVSDSLGGPWLPLAPNTLGMCSNPAPHVHRNGSLFVLCSHTTLLRAESIHGPWVEVCSLTNATNGGLPPRAPHEPSGVAGKWEDPVSSTATRVFPVR